MQLLEVSGAVDPCKCR